MVVVQKNTVPDCIANPFGLGTHVPGVGEIVAFQLDVPLCRPTSDGLRGPPVPGAGEVVLVAENLAEAMSRRSQADIVNLCMPCSPTIFAKQECFWQQVATAGLCSFWWENKLRGSCLQLTLQQLHSL